MARVFKLNDKSVKSIQSCCEELAEGDSNLEQDLYDIFYTIVFNDVKMIKDCSELYIVKFYIESLKDELTKVYDINEILDDNEFWTNLKQIARQKLVHKYVSDKSFDNNIDIYFNEVKREYILHPQSESEELEFCEENKDVFIKNNLKLVIECAKRYQNLGIPFEDLIQAGNIGLLTAFEKFDTERANLRFSIIKSIKEYNKDEFTYEDACAVIRTNFTYTKLLDATLSKIPAKGFPSKQRFIDWANVNIKKATFSSISFAWIRAYIVTELNKYSKIIKASKSDDERLSIIRLDSINPYTEDNYTDGELADQSNEDFEYYDETLVNNERQQLCKDLLETAFQNMPGINKRIMQKKFGINYPFQMSLQEISESEGISVNQVKYIIKQSTKIIKESINDKDLNSLMEILYY